MQFYLACLSGVASWPHKLHDGHKHSYDEATNQNYKDPANILHAET